MSLFISFEGCEGSGKSTQAKLLYERLLGLDVAVKHIREPGATELGGYVREWLKRGLPVEKTISSHAELFLFSAARAELVTKELRHHLSIPNAAIVADRYADSTTAYQGYGRGIPLHQIEVVNALATQGVMPDLTFLLDISPAEGLARVGAVQYGFRLDVDILSIETERHMEGGRFEDEPLAFHERVRQGYLELAAKEPARFHIIDAAQPQHLISDRIWETLHRRFSEAIPHYSTALRRQTSDTRAN